MKIILSVVGHEERIRLISLVVHKYALFHIFDLETNTGDTVHYDYIYSHITDFKFIYSLDEPDIKALVIPLDAYNIIKDITWKKHSVVRVGLVDDCSVSFPENMYYKLSSDNLFIYDIKSHSRTHLLLSLFITGDYIIDDDRILLSFQIRTLDCDYNGKISGSCEDFDKFKANLAKYILLKG